MSTQVSTNGNQNADVTRFSKTISLDKVVRRTASMPGVGADGVKYPKHSELYQEGYRFARDSKAIDEDEGHIRVLTVRAKAAVGELEFGPFDPDNNPADRETLNKKGRLEDDRKEVREQLRRSEGELLDVKKAAVNFPAPAASRPDEPAALIILSAVFLGIPLMPTAFDFWAPPDPVLHWTSAVLISLFIGVPVAKLLFYVPPARSKESSHIALVGLFFALGVAVGFGAIRVALGGSYWMAGGLTALELFIILAIEIVAKRYRHAVQEWDEQEEAHRKAANLAELQGGRVEELQKRLDDIQAATETIEEELYIRHLLATQPDRVKESFAGSIVAGYSHGIAENKAGYEAYVRR